MAEYNVDIQVRAKTQQVESQLTKLQQQLERLSSAAARIDFNTPEKAVRNLGNTARTVGTEIRNIFGRGLFAGAVLGAGQLSTSITDVINKFGFLGKTAATSINASLGGVPELLGGILNQIGHIPNAMGLAAVAAMAFAPQLLKASSAAVGLGAAVDKAVGKQVTENIAGTIGQIGALKTAVDATKTSFADLIKGSTLNQLNSQLKDAKIQIGEYHSSTQQAVTAASQLVAVLRAQKAEQKAINDLVRSAQGLRPESEERRATNTYNVTQRRNAFRKKQLEELNELQASLLRLEEKSAEAANRRLEQQSKLALITARGVNAKKFELAQTQAEGKATLMLPAFRERGLQVLDNTLKLNESNLRIEQALNGERARGVRFLEKQSAEEARQVELGILGRRSTRLPGTSSVQAGPFPTEGPISLSQYGAGRTRAGRAGAGMRGNVGQAVSGALIGGAFPLLFGQGAGAAAGGAIGGLVGGLAGPGGSFAGSLVGTLLGDIATKGQQVKQLAADIGLSAEQTKQLGQAFQSAGRDFDKFQAAVQNIRGIGLSIEDQADAIALSSKLAETYGGKVDKIAQAFANFASTGKVGIADINKFTAQGIPILDALEKKYGKNRDQILQMAKDGKISAQELANSLVEIGNSSQNSANKVDKGFEKAFRLVREGAELNVRALLALLTPLTGGYVKTAGDIAVAFAQLYRNLVTGAIGAAQKIAQSLVSIAKALSQYAGNFTLGGFNKIAVFAQDKFNSLEQTAKNIGTALGAVKLDESVQKVGDISLPGELPSTGGTGKDKNAAKAAQELKRVQEVIRAQGLITLENQRQLMFKDAIFKAEMANDPVLARRLQGEQQLLEWGIETANLLEKEKNTNAQLAIARAQQAKQALILLQTKQAIEEIDRRSNEMRDAALAGSNDRINRLQAEIQGNERSYELTRRITELETSGLPRAEAEAQAQTEFRLLDIKNQQIAAQQQLNGLVNQLGTSASQVFEDLVLGTNSWQQSLANALNTMAMALFRFGLNTLADMGDPAGQGVGLFSILTGRFGKRAAGGPVSAGSPYLVGERGPELFMPRTSGSIYPNDAMGVGGSNIVVNVDATGTNVQGNSDDSKRLGEAIGVAIRQELIKQKRPGGLLS